MEVENKKKRENRNINTKQVINVEEIKKKEKQEWGGNNEGKMKEKRKGNTKEVEDAEEIKQKRTNRNKRRMINVQRIEKERRGETRTPEEGKGKKKKNRETNI